jgi:predicted ATP-grasp superfamily ATP-dependent carboligase
MTANGLHVVSDRPVVLIGFADALAAPEVTWSLQDSGFSVIAFYRRGTRPALRRLRDVRLFPITAPEVDVAQAMADLVALVEVTRPQAVMPLNDPAVWLVDGASGELNVPIAGPTGDAARVALDKAVQLERARAAGFAVPSGIDGASDNVAAQAPYPCVVKPAHAVHLRDGRLVTGSALACANRGELEAALRKLDGTGPLLIQELVVGCGEGLFGLAGTGGVGWWSAHRRVRMLNPAGSGSSACVGIPVAPEAQAAAEQMVQALGWRGLFMIELLRDHAGGLWFVELNGRPWGSMALARRTGFEYPAWAVQAALGAEPSMSAVPATRPILCRHLGREVVHVLFVLRGPQSSASAAQWPGRLQTIRNVLRIGRSDRLYNWRRDNLRFFVADTVQTVTNVVAGHGRR